MVIFNEREMKSPYTKTENRIIDINSPLDFYDIVQDLIDGKDIDPEKVAITTYRYSQDEFTFQNNTNEDTAKIVYNHILSEDEMDAINDQPYERPIEFKMFELYNFGQFT